ncbi:MAG: metal ABC transporter substrate-binding protein, partial [Methanomicrobiaceae archaeon]|nr:metal ABC transporter substrate-binding protein [Methanomicrobiaceae archaeon]
MSAQRLILLALAALLIAAPASATLKVVSTTSVLWDPIRHIGGEKVEAIYLADPALCPHMQPDVINNRIQLQREFIRDADLFVAHNGTVDQTYVMPFVEKFMDANRYGEIAWVTPEDPAAIWNTPADARDLVTEVKGWLVAADPANEAYYEERYLSYIALINATEPDEEERDLIGGQDVIVMYWQKDAAEQWLGLNVVGFFAPEFVLAGQHTPA